MELAALVRTVAGVVALGAACAPALAAGDDEKVRLRLIAERSALVAGETNWLGVQFDIADGWHIYWKGQNDTGSPPEVKTSLPEGFVAGDLVWPAPRRHIYDGPLLDHVYEKRIVLLLPVRVPADAAPGKPIALKVSADWMVCKSACIVGSGEASLTLPVAAAGSKPEPTKEAPLFIQARERIPTPALGDGSVVSWEWKGSTLVLKSAKGKKIAFYPFEDSAKLTDAIKDAASEKGRLELRITGSGHVKGVVEITPDTGNVRPIVQTVDVPPPGENSRGVGASNPPPPR